MFNNAYKSYGYRRIQAVLQNDYNIAISGKTVRKLMHQEQLHCLVRKKKYKSYKGDVGKVAPNILSRQFSTPKPNTKWVTDVTEFSVLGTKYYFSPMIDLFDGQVISWSIATSPALPLIERMLEGAFSQIKPGDQPMVHSDQGWQYQHKYYQKALADRGLSQSMSRKGNCLDNAMAENFFGHFKQEFLVGRKFTSIERFKLELIEYLDWYNKDRIQIKLGGLSPVQYRAKAA